MGCCESKQSVLSGLNAKMIEKMEYKPKKPLRLSEYTFNELNRELDFQVVCITKPELSYIIKINNAQLETWTLYNLEVQIIEDLKDHMIESFRFAQMNEIQKSFYNQKMIQFMDLFPIYIELSVDETMEYIQIEIPHSKQVINLPYEPNSTIKYIKKKITEQVQFDNNEFELMHLGEILLIDDMSLEDYKICPQSIITVTTNSHQQSPQIGVYNKHSFKNQDIPYPIKRQSNLDLQNDLTFNNITKIQTKIYDEDQTAEILDNFDIISTKSQDYHNRNRRDSNRSTKENDKLTQSFKKQSSKQDKMVSQSEVQMKNYFNMQLTQGINVLCECQNSDCNQYKLKQVIHLSYGEFFINAREQTSLVDCASCQNGMLMNECLFYNCRYIVSGIYKPKQQQQCNSKCQKDQLCKMNDSQWINTKNDEIDNYDFQVDQKDWKSVRIRVRPLKKIKLGCSLCTRSINQQKENQVKLTCNHIYHENCIQKLKNVNSTCLMCVF